MKQNDTKPYKKLDKIIMYVMLYWLIFVGISWITYWVKGDVPDTLIQYGLGGGAIELVISGIIEVMRDRKVGKNYDS